MVTSHRHGVVALIGVCLLTGCGSADIPLESTVESTASQTPVSSAPEGPAGPDTTGVPDGVELTASPGVRVTQDGEVLSGLDIDGCVVIAANDVTIRNSRIRCDDDDVTRVVTGAGDVSGFVIEDSEVDGRGVVDIGIDISRSVIRRVDVHGVNDGVRMGSEIMLLDSWIHDLNRKEELHPDAIQGISSHDIVIRGNTLDPVSRDGQDLGNAAIMWGSEAGRGTSVNVLIEDNILDGGNYALNVRGDIDAYNIVVRSNTFGDRSRYGPVIAPDDDDVDIAPDNVLESTGESIDVDRP